MISSMFWRPLVRNKHIPYKLHYYFLSLSISFPYFFSRSARNKGNMNASVTGFEVKNVRQVMDFNVFESPLGSSGVISSTFWTP